ncbi:15733_t:CDS:2, partial [Racocetra persica]
IQEDSKEKVTEVQELLKLRAFVLRVAEEEGWKVAAKIPKPTPSETDEFRELLTEARKQAKPSEGFPASYSRGTWRSRGSSWSPGPRQNYYTPYPLPYSQPQPYVQHPPPISATKQFNCYFCGGTGHTAAVYPSKSAEEQGGCRKNTRASSREILDGKDRTPASSSLLVKELNAPFPRNVWSLVEKGDPKSYKLMAEQKVWLEEELNRLERLGDRATTKAKRDKSLFENIVGNKLGNSQTVGK